MLPVGSPMTMDESECGAKYCLNLSNPFTIAFSLVAFLLRFGCGDRWNLSEICKETVDRLAPCHR